MALWVRKVALKVNLPSNLRKNSDTRQGRPSFGRQVLGRYPTG